MPYFQRVSVSSSFPARVQIFIEIEHGHEYLVASACKTFGWRRRQPSCRRESS